jgi:hypothetical protein
MNRFSEPAGEPVLPRRGGCFPLDEVSFTLSDSGAFTFFADCTSGHALTQLRINYIISRGEPDSDFWLDSVEWSIPGENKWRTIDCNSTLFWGVEALLETPDIAASFEAWRSENTSIKPREFNIFKLRRVA